MRRELARRRVARKKTPQDVVDTILVSSRRRCCICFGLDRDAELKSGQIAHLDHNPDNNRIENLAFLCLRHHDEYDSRASQRKGLTNGEVKTYRNELVSTVNRAFTQRVHFGEIKTPPADPYAGQYVRLGEGYSAEITLTPLPDSFDGQAQYFVRGLALWGSDRPRGPNLGTLEFVGPVEDGGEIIYRRSSLGVMHKTTIVFPHEGVLKVSEDNWPLSGQYGINVNFIGTYRRADLAK